MQNPLTSLLTKQPIGSVLVSVFIDFSAGFNE